MGLLRRSPRVMNLKDTTTAYKKHMTEREIEVLLAHPTTFTNLHNTTRDDENKEELGGGRGFTCFKAQKLLKTQVGCIRW